MAIIKKRCQCLNSQAPTFNELADKTDTNLGKNPTSASKKKDEREQIFKSTKIL